MGDPGGVTTVSDSVFVRADRVAYALGIAEQVRFALDSAPDCYGNGVAEQLWKLPKAYQDCVRLVSSAEFRVLLDAVKSANGAPRQDAADPQPRDEQQPLQETDHDR